MKNFIMLLLGVIPLTLYAQVNISGKVTDESGEGLSSATVLEKGTLNGTLTNVDGNFTLTVNENAVIVFSFTGYRTQEVKVNGKTQINVALDEGINLGEVQIVGSRSYKRSVVNSPVPIDVVDMPKVSASNGQAEISQILQYTVPSFNAGKQSGSDGADHIVPASLRGLGPDQTLVLINGKRRHQSSLVNLFGTRGRGNTGTDFNAFPISAIKRIEILRDGASAQYGSDAIAGVINIVLKDNTDGFSGALTYGVNSTKAGGDYAQQIFDTQDGWEPELSNIEGKNRIDGKDKSFDGNTVKLDLNYGTKLGTKGGFINITTEYLTKKRTLRPSFDWRKGYGTPALDGFNFFVNSAIPLGKNTEIYAFGGRSYRNTDAYAFTRPGFSDEDNRAVPSLYPNGFSPRITSTITDGSVTAGVRHTMENEWVVDFSNTYGKNYFHYYIKGTNNASLGTASGTTFDAGGHNLSMNTTGLNFSKFFEDPIEGINLAFGFENRVENFKIFAGEEASYTIYDSNRIAITNPAIQSPAVDSYGNLLPGASQGFPGYSPANVVDEYRTNFSVYADAEFNFTKDFLLSSAIRFENYSDFGKTFNFKLATRYSINDEIAIRGAFSTGFRAPSLAQIHYNLLFNDIVKGSSVRTLLSSNTSVVTKAFGISELKQETATNASLGFTYSKNGFSATIDVYSIAVNDRIILTDKFDATHLNLNVENTQFFANGVDTRTQGLDMVFNYRTDIGNGKLNVGLVGNFNKLKIDKINNGALNRFTFFSPFSEAYLAAASPKHKLGLNIGYNVNKFDVVLRTTRFSEVIIQDFQWVDEPATNQSEANALLAKATDTYEAKYVFDLSASIQITNNLRLTVGSNNLFNVNPTPQFDGWTDQGGFNDAVQMGADGAYFFGRLGFNF